MFSAYKQKKYFNFLLTLYKQNVTIILVVEKDDGNKSLKYTIKQIKNISKNFLTSKTEMVYYVGVAAKKELLREIWIFEN